MKTAITLDPGMGTAIVNHLRQFTELPSQGILAGQAVDSAITDLFGSGGGVYNDIDVFRREDKPFENHNPRKANALTTRFELAVAAVGSYGDMNVLLETLETYSIHSVRRDGMLNTVNCALNWQLKSLSAERVISGFDINCTRVAVDLSTNRLAWDRHYEDFLHSRQLRISMMHTPWHTFLRLAKKAEELPSVYADFDVAAEACVAIARSEWLHLLQKNKGVSMAFGKKHQELAERFKSLWDPYFNFEKKRLYLGSDNRWSEQESHGRPDGKAVDLCGMLPRGELDGRLQERCNRMGSGIVFFAPRVIESSRRKVAPAAYHKLNAIVAQRQDDTESVKDGASVWRAAVRARGAYPDFVQANVDILDTDYVQGQGLPTMAAKVSEWVRQHRGLARGMLGMTLDEQYARMQVINEVSRVAGKKYFDGDTKAAFGVLETHTDASVFTSRAAMEQVLVDYYLTYSAPFDIKPLPLPTVVPAQFSDFHVRELLSPHELKREGTEMGHCVGGYADSVRRGTSRILAVRYRDERRTLNCSTVELRGSFDAEAPVLTVAQNYSVSNQHPTAENKAFVAYLLTHFRAMGLLKACEGRSAYQAGRILRQEARKQETLVRQLKRALHALRTEEAPLLRKAAPEASRVFNRPLTNVQETIRHKTMLLDQAKAKASLLRDLDKVGKAFPVRVPRERPQLPEGSTTTQAEVVMPDDELAFF